MPITIEYLKEKDEFVAKTRGFELVAGSIKDWGFKETKGFFPSELLVASIGFCATMHTITFCKKNRVPTEGVKIVMSSEADNPRGGKPIPAINLDVTVPNFPLKLKEGLMKVLEKECRVALTVLQVPKITYQIV